MADDSAELPNLTEHVLVENDQNVNTAVAGNESVQVHGSCQIYMPQNSTAKQHQRRNNGGGDTISEAPPGAALHT